MFKYIKPWQKKYREELNDPASSNHIVKTAATWNEDITSSSIYKTKQKDISYFFIERLRKLYTPNTPSHSYKREKTTKKREIGDMDTFRQEHKHLFIVLFMENEPC